MNTLHAHRALLPEGWADEADVAIDAAGRIARVGRDERGRDAASVLLPGIPNVHSHAFQRALAGRTERAGSRLGSDPGSFWSWREQMYALAARTTPAALEAIATWLYVEMLEAGYTAVAEFHYLHRLRDAGTRDPAAASRALVRAACATGIRLTLLPVLYQHGGFGARPPEPAQAPFVTTLPDYLALLDTLRVEQGDGMTLGIAFHSLRAVSPDAIEAVLDWRARALPGCPVHIHVAEQPREVEECRAWSGLRPVEWLLARGWLDEHWCLVHATHATAEELGGLAATGAVVGLCPTTEANLGDGLFPLAPWLEAGGRVGIGSDSHVSVSPVEELRWLEYGQRLAHLRRHVAASETEPHTGARLVRAALAGGAAALGWKGGALEPGCVADLIELDATHPVLAGADHDELLDRWVFAGNRPLVRRAWVGGRLLVQDGRHERAAEAARAFTAVLSGSVS